MSVIRVDFYLLRSEQADDRYLLACRLLEKAYYKGHRVFVLCTNQQEAELIDELLWTFKADSFIPHNLEGEGPIPPPPIHIGYQKEPRGFNDILLNLAPEIPPFAPQFKRIIELVSHQDEQKELSRLHYKHYKTQGYSLHVHEMP